MKFLFSNTISKIILSEKFITKTVNLFLADTNGFSRIRLSRL